MVVVPDAAPIPRGERQRTDLTRHRRFLVVTARLRGSEQHKARAIMQQEITTPLRPWWDKHDVGRYLKVAPRRALDLAHLGVLPAYRIPNFRGLRFRPEDVEALPRPIGTPATTTATDRRNDRP